MPVGRCVILTAESVLLTCWPPAPEALYVSTLRSFSSISTSTASPTTGATATEAKLVCLLAPASKGLILTRRCTPRSADKSPKAYSPETVKVALFMPASSPSVYSITSSSKPRRSAQRWYMRASISAQSCESTPPAPEFMVSMASPSSYSPAKSLATSCSSSTRSTRLSSSLTSGSNSPSSSASSRSSPEPERLSLSPSRSSILPCTLEKRADTALASWGSSQKPGRLMSSPSSSASVRNLSTSKNASSSARRPSSSDVLSLSSVTNLPGLLTREGARQAVRGTSCTSCRYRTDMARCARSWSLSCAGSSEADSALRHRCRELLHLLLAQLDVLHAVDVGDVVLLQAPLHLLEDVETLPLVFDQRIALRETTPADSLAQVVHLVEVLPPARIDHREQRPALVLLESGHPVAAREPTPLELGGPLVPLGLALLEAFVGVLEDHGEDFCGRKRLDVEGLEVDTVRIEAVYLGREGVQVPVFGVDVLGDVFRDDFCKHVVHVGLRVDVLPHKYVASYGVDHLALFVEDVIVLEYALANLEVAALYLLLGAPHGVGDHTGLDRHVLFEPYALDDPLHPLAAEEPEELVLEGQVEPGLAGVALPSRAASQLIVYTARLVTLGAENVESAELGHSLAELDVCTAARHVRRYGYGAPLAGPGDDLRLPLVLLGVEYVVSDSTPAQQRREALRDVDGDRANEDGLALFVSLDDILDDGLVLGLLALVDEVVFVVPDHLLVRRDGDDFHLVGVHELVGLGRGRPRHARELVVHPEEILDGDGCYGLVLFLDLDALFGLDGLVEPLGVTPALEHPPGELVDDVDLPVGDDIFVVFLEERLRPQRLV